jgi:predicted dehydrogenase
LIEKRAGRCAAELLPIKEASERRRNKVKIGYNHRFHPALLHARALVDEAALGPLMCVRGRYGHGGRIGMEKEWRCQKSLSGGGELIDQGVHLIDLARWFLGKLRLDYGAALTSYWPIAIEDNCFLALRGAGGEMARLHASWSEWKNMFSFEIYARDGKLTIEGLGGSYGLERLTFIACCRRGAARNEELGNFLHPTAPGNWISGTSSVPSRRIARRWRASPTHTLLSNWWTRFTNEA